MRYIYWTSFGELRTFTLDENGYPIIEYPASHELKGLLAKGCVEISERTARAMYLPV